MLNCLIYSLISNRLSLSIILYFLPIRYDEIDLVLKRELILLIDFFCFFHFQIQVEDHSCQNHYHYHKEARHSNSPEEPGIRRNKLNRNLSLQIQLIWKVNVMDVKHMLDVIPLIQSQRVRNVLTVTPRIIVAGLLVKRGDWRTIGLVVYNSPENPVVVTLHSGIRSEVEIVHVVKCKFFLIVSCLLYFGRNVNRWWA